MKKHIQSLIMLGSEIAWVYYMIVLFTSAEWNRAVAYPVTGLLIAGLLGYTLNHLLISRTTQYAVYALNLLVLLVLLYFQWFNVLTDGSTGFRTAVSIGLIGLYMRGIIMLLREPKRGNVLLHFELNLVIYTLLAVIFSANQWMDPWFHLIFISAILASLFSMVLSLHQHLDTDENDTIKTIRSGKSGWFMWSVSSIFIVIPLLASFILIPGVNQRLQSAGISLWKLAAGLGSALLAFMFWLISLIPYNPQTASIELPPPLDIPEQNQMEEIMISEFPLLVIGISLALISVLAVLWLLSRRISLKNMPKPRYKRMVLSEKTPLRQLMAAFIRKHLKRLMRTIRLRFRSSYRHQIYWYFQQVQVWGKKNKLPRKPTETSSEYLRRIATGIPGTRNTFILGNTKYSMTETLAELGESFQAVYYGGKDDPATSCRQYDAMLENLDETVSQLP